MAQINIDTIRKIDKERNTLHDKVFSTYTSFEKDGKKYFQLDTYGKANREMPEKISQSIQLDEDAARLLIDLLVKELNIPINGNR